MLKRFISLGLILLLISLIEIKLQTATQCSTASVVDIDTDGTSEAVMPSAAPAGATLFGAFYNRSNETDTIDTVVGSTNSTGWTASTNSPVDFTGAGTGKTYVYYRLNAAAATDTVTVTWTNVVLNVQALVGWCEDDSTTSPQTFDAEATPTQTTPTTTTWTLTAVNATQAGPVLGFIFPNNSQTADATSLGAGESQISVANSGVRIMAFRKDASGSGSYGFSMTIINSLGVGQVLAFGNPSAGTGANQGGMLMRQPGNRK